MKVLIIGGAGYVGQSLTKQCLESGDEVSVFDNFSNGDTEARNTVTALPIRVIEASIEDRDAVHGVISEGNYDIIYHLAAIHYIPYCIAHSDEVFRTNIMGTQYVIEAIRACAQMPRLIFASSASVYGSSDVTCTEPSPICPNDIYGASKASGELLIQHQLQDYVIMRLFNVFGDFDPTPHLIPKVVDRAIHNQDIELGTSSAWRDFVHVGDVARAFHCARGARLASVYNVATGEPHQVSETVAKIYELSDASSRIVYETDEHMRTNDASFLSGDASRLQADLGWSPKVAFADGLVTAIVAARGREATTRT